MAYKDKQTRKNKHFGEALFHAIAGIKVVFKEERNFKIQLLISFFTVIIASIIGMSKVEWLILIITITLVIILELVNTVIETVVDLVTAGTYHPLAKKAKDIAASSVLVASVSAVIIGGILFLPKLMR